jgi:hypothetical protein
VGEGRENGWNQVYNVDREMDGDLLE